MNIIMETIPHKRMRYDTLGDWMETESGLLIQVSDRCNKDFKTDKGESQCKVHELIEAILCLDRGITAKVVDKFDFKFKGKGEPGDDPKAPYGKEHRFAMIMEHMLAHERGIRPYGRVE